MNGELFEVLVVASGECVSEDDVATPANIIVGPGYYKFLGWSIDGETILDLSSYPIVQNVNFVALFSKHAIPMPV